MVERIPEHNRLKIIARADELHQGTHVVSIRRLKRSDICGTARADLLEIVSARPVNRLCFVNTIQHGIRHYARVPPSARCLLLPEQPTSMNTAAMSEKCQYQT
jgi:hypothetical protein